VARAVFVFTSLKNSFKVYIENLEKLSVEQIIEIEEFVSKRKGLFDFNTYTFSIQKKIDFFEFEQLIKYANINAICREEALEKGSQERVGFGYYKGMLYSELPDSYIIWLNSNYIGSDKKIITQEIKKRRL
jgi:hypothetical protein